MLRNSYAQSAKVIKPAKCTTQTMTQAANLVRSIGKTYMILQSQQRIPESYEVCQLMVTNETLYDSVVLMKDIGPSYEVCQLMVTNEKQRKTELKLNRPITRCFLKTN